MDSLGDDNRDDAELTAPGPLVGDQRHFSSGRLGESPECRSGPGATQTPHRGTASLESPVATERRLGVRARPPIIHSPFRAVIDVADESNQLGG